MARKSQKQKFSAELIIVEDGVHFKLHKHPAFL